MKHTPIEQLDLNVRTYNCLKRAGINSIEEVKSMSEEDLNNIRNLKRNGLRDIQERLAEFKLEDNVKLFKIFGQDEYGDEVVILKVSRNEQELREKLSELMFAGELYIDNLSLCEMSEIDGYNIKLEKNWL